MKLIVSMITVLMSANAFAYTTGNFECGSENYKLSYEISDSGVSGLPLVTVSNANTVHKGLGQVTKTQDNKGQAVETVRLNMGSGAFQISFVDGKTNCTKID